MYRAMPLSLRNAATKVMMAMEYMAMRWYQHSLQGAYPTLSLKYKLPTMAVPVMAHMAHTPYSFTVEIHVVAHEAFVRSDAKVTRPPKRATNAKRALNDCTASEFMSPILTPFTPFSGGSGRIIG